MATTAKTFNHPQSVTASNPKPNSNGAGLTEIVLSGLASTPDYSMVLPMLAHLSQQSHNKWFTWIAPKGIDKALLLSFGFNLNNVRVIYPSDTADIPWLFWEALSNNTSDTVVAEAGSLSESDFSKLESACYNSGCRGLLLRFR